MKRAAKFIRTRLFHLMVGVFIGSTFTANPGFGWVHIGIILAVLLVAYRASGIDDEEK